MMNMFIDWCKSLYPQWVGFVAGMSGYLFLVCVLFMALAYVVVKTKGHVLWAVPAVVAYAWYIALFGQP